MNTHKHARLTFLRRLEMVQQLIAHQVCVPEAARAYGVTAPTVRKWLGRFLAQGQAGLADASSRPTVSPRAIAPAKALAIVELRRKRLTQARIARRWACQPAPSAASWPAPVCRTWPTWSRPSRWCATSIRPPAICCTSTSRSWDVSSALATGSRATDAIPLRGPAGTSSSWPSMTTPGGLHRHPPDERFPSAVQFLKDAVAYYQRLGVTIQRLLTDNGSAFRSRAFAALCHELGIKHRFTRPYRPQTNGKAERFIQSALREWAYAHTYQNSQHRADAMKSWLHHYNWHRPHQGIGRAVPISRLNLDEYNLLTVHT
ncbi:transposase, IS481 family [Bordetella pertussis H918]|nr:transposase, IS481 family [Bordetella pertussis H918]ETH40772.1 transposase, IS481 family [Bordetella pertussis H918]